MKTFRDRWTDQDVHDLMIMFFGALFSLAVGLAAILVSVWTA